jgi:hypothetical protein
MKKELDVEYIKSRLSYNGDNGVFLWRKRENYKGSWNARFAGKVAGSLSFYGYYIIVIDNKLYLAHRLAWVITYSEWPKEEIDHIDGDRSNNKISNLRLATSQENKMNSSIRSDNTSGLKGVSWSKCKNKWKSHINFCSKQKHLGYYEKIEDARAAREAAEIRYFGEFRRAS